MVIDESTPLLPHQEIEEAEISTLQKQISSYHTELNNRNEEIYELHKKVWRNVLKIHFSVSKIQMLRILIFLVVLKLIHSNRF